VCEGGESTIQRHRQCTPENVRTPARPRELWRRGIRTQITLPPHTLRKPRTVQGHGRAAAGGGCERVALGMLHREREGARRVVKGVRCALKVAVARVLPAVNGALRRIGWVCARVCKGVVGEWAGGRGVRGRGLRG
jgi:hypothetical protein